MHVVAAAAGWLSTADNGNHNNSKFKPATTKRDKHYNQIKTAPQRRQQQPPAQNTAQKSKNNFT